LQTIGFASPETGDQIFLNAAAFLDARSRMTNPNSIIGDGRSVALGPAASPLLRVRRFARASPADRPGEPALPASRCCARLLAASGE
jgi:hypothetical protein